MNDLITALMGRVVDSLATKAEEFSKEAWEKFKVDFGSAFHEYLKRSCEKYSRIKTILYRSEPQYIYDFFEIPYLEKQEDQPFKTCNAKKVLQISRFIIIQGTGGIGKSTLMKHLFISTLESENCIPMFLELKDINSLELRCSIEDIILNKLNTLGCELERSSLEYALKSGKFVFLLDGYDEILSKNKDWFFREANAFCDRYPENHYVISSRECSDFIAFQRFTILKACPLTKQQAISLVSKIKFDVDIKQNFINELENGLYEKHESFAANPLLLNIMLLTYDNYAEIPKKLHIFYSDAFDTLYSRHDATKGGYKREFRSSLPREVFKDIFARFCFLSYAKGKIEFSYEQLQEDLKKASSKHSDFRMDEYIDDLINAVCLLYKDGLNYRFTHRLFQEYFTAFFLKTLSDERMEQAGRQLIDKDMNRAMYDSVFDMLYDMDENRFERNILLPIIYDFEEELEGDRYEFYFRNCLRGVDLIEFKDVERTNTGNLHLLPLTRRCFLSGFMWYYFSEYEIKKFGEGSNKVFDCLSESERISMKEITVEDVMEDDLLYERIKQTWIGVRISVLADLKNRIEQKHREIDMDLDKLLGD
ncbi:MAG: NACHT domain-containing protein [Filifactor alocis]|nr:NACHT domain-containing protein [Filifactor alocis]